MKKISIVTTNYNRSKLLLNQIEQLKLILPHNTEVELEHIIVNIADSGIEISNLPNNYDLIQIQSELENGQMNISKSRNLGAHRASSDYLIFLDADCIPDNNFLNIYLDCFSNELNECIFTGHAWYLKDNANFKAAQNDLTQNIQYYKPGLDIRSPYKYVVINNYQTFSSIHFGLTKKDFILSGGFDINYLGYGCEDTDYSLNLQKLGISIAFNKAEVYHQYHKPSGAPYGAIKEFVNNANYFKSKWGFLPAQSWIDEFLAKKLIFIDSNNQIHLTD